MMGLAWLVRDLAWFDALDAFAILGFRRCGFISFTLFGGRKEKSLSDRMRDA